MKGGLKAGEKQLGIKRKSKIVSDLGSGQPYQLWRMFLCSKDRYYLNILIEYNLEDTINLQAIAKYAYNCLLRKAMNIA